MLQLDISLHLAPLSAESMQSRSLTTKHSPLTTPLLAFWIHRVPKSGEQMSDVHLLQTLRYLHRSGTGKNASTCSTTSHGSFSPDPIARLKLSIGDPPALYSFLEIRLNADSTYISSTRSSHSLTYTIISLTAAQQGGSLNSSKSRLPPTSATQKDRHSGSRDGKSTCGQSLLTINSTSEELRLFCNV